MDYPSKILFMIASFTGIHSIAFCLSMVKDDES